MILFVINNGGMGSSQYNKYRTVQTALILRQFFFICWRDAKYMLLYI